VKSRAINGQSTEIQCRVDVEEDLAREQAARAAAEREAKRAVELLALTTALLRASSVVEVVRAAAAHVPPTLGATMATCHVHGVEEATLDPADRMPPELTEVSLPLRAGGRQTGVLSLGFRGPKSLGEEERAFALTVADHCAAALERALFHAGTARLAERLATLYEASTRARAEAESANQAKDDFLSTVSHELRTPLAAILGWANILRSRTLPSEAVARALAVIERNARTQVQLIEDILDVSRMATGKLRLEMRAVDPKALVRTAVESARPSAEAQGVSLEAVIEDGVGIGAADPARLQQIVCNLLSNAIKFTPRGGRVEVCLGQCQEGIRLRVTDTGKGIDTSFLPHVFERFRQAEEGNSRTHGGLGLGLSIVKHLVELHGGTIHAESAGRGRGATFTVTLPLPPDAAVLLEDSVAGSRTGGMHLRLEGVRVVIVDDNADARELVAAILSAQGAITTLAASAEEGFLAVERGHPDVLVSDIGMPDEDGYALLRRVRAVAAVPALALTAHASAQDVQTAEQAGFEGYLAKPVAPGKLIDAVVELAGVVRKADKGSP
jgi:signal transduction histidine kinase/CheY-like chemotaxis protein